MQFRKKIQQFMYTEERPKKSKALAAVSFIITIYIIWLQYLSVLSSDNLIRSSNIVIAIIIGGAFLSPRKIALLASMLLQRQ